VRWLWYALRDRVAPVRPGFLPAARAALLGGNGLEIGGPSRIFRSGGGLPVYAWAATLDNVNFASETAWEHALHDDGPFLFHPAKPPGRQWLREAADLQGLDTGTFAFVASSHCLEHLANPLAALAEWHRVTRAGGHLLVVVPDPAHTFDHRRPVTTLAHLQADRVAGTPESDTTHFAEVLAQHDLAHDPTAGDAAAFRHHVANNALLRCVHHHVFDAALLAAALQETGWSPVAVEPFAPMHLGALARKEAP
jgi:SAM-dependent methyltransferase